jgi:hypothetical protein
MAPVAARHAARGTADTATAAARSFTVSCWHTPAGQPVGTGSWRRFTTRSAATSSKTGESAR